MTPTEINKEIAEWLGNKVEPLSFKSVYQWMATPEDLQSAYGEGCDPYTTPLPDYFHSNAAAIGLLDVLVGKGYTYTLEGSKNNHECVLSKIKWADSARASNSPTISSAICTAIIQLIEKEKADENMSEVR